MWFSKFTMTIILLTHTMMKKTILMAVLIAAPTLTFAGGMGNANYSSMMNNAQTTSAPAAVAPATTSSDFGSTENPSNIVESRQVSGSESDNYVRYSFGFIPKSYWDQYVDLGDVNGLIELEEYLGETEREIYSAGEDIDREAERQTRARNKALRLRSAYRR